MYGYVCDCEGEHTELCVRSHLSYKEIAARAKAPVGRAAPPEAKPKYSKGDTHRFRAFISNPGNPDYIDLTALRIKRGKVKRAKS